MDEDVLQLEARRRIYAFVHAHPGAYLREIQRGVGMAMGALEYHLDQLVAARLLTVEHEMNKRYFPAKMSPEDRRALTVLRQDALRRIVTLLMETPGATHKELVRRTGFPPSTVSYYLSKLVDAHFVERRRAGRDTCFELRDAQRIYALLVQYKPTFLDRVLDAFLEGFDAIHLRLPDEE